MDKIIERLKKMGAKEEDLVAAKQELQEYVDSEVNGLKEKNVSLIKKLKLARTGEGKADTSALEEKVDELEGKLEEATREKDRLTREYTRKEKELSTKAEGESAAVTKLIVEGGLRDSFAKLGVKAQQVPYLIAGLRSKVTVRVDGENRIAEIEGKPLGEYVEKVWAGSDEGKAFIPLRSSGGAGDVGDRKGGDGKPATVLRSDWNKMDPTAQMEHVQKGGQVVDN